MNVVCCESSCVEWTARLALRVAVCAVEVRKPLNSCVCARADVTCVRMCRVVSLLLTFSAACTGWRSLKAAHVIVCVCTARSDLIIIHGRAAQGMPDFL